MLLKQNFLSIYFLSVTAIWSRRYNKILKVSYKFNLLKTFLELFKCFTHILFKKFILEMKYCIFKHHLQHVFHFQKFYKTLSFSNQRDSYQKLNEL